MYFGKNNYLLKYLHDIMLTFLLYKRPRPSDYSIDIL